MTHVGAIIVVAAVVIGFAVWSILAPRYDRQRIARHLRARGATEIVIAAHPSTTDRNERGYRVGYRDRDGRARIAICKTSALTGIFWGEDAITESATTDDELARLREENRDLRRQLAELRGEPTRDRA